MGIRFGKLSRKTTCGSQTRLRSSSKNKDLLNCYVMLDCGMLCITKEVFMFLKNSFYALTCICLTVTLMCCSSGSQDMSSDYKEKVEL